MSGKSKRQKITVRELRGELQDLRQAFQESNANGLSLFLAWNPEKACFEMMIFEPSESFFDGVVNCGTKDAAHSEIVHSQMALMIRAGTLCELALPRLAKPVSYAKQVLGANDPSFVWAGYLCSAIRGHCWTRQHTNHIVEIANPVGASLSAIDDLLSQLPVADSSKPDDVNSQRIRDWIISNPNANTEQVQDAIERITGTRPGKEAARQTKSRALRKARR